LYFAENIVKCKDNNVSNKCLFEVQSQFQPKPPSLKNVTTAFTRKSLPETGFQLNNIGQIKATF